MTAHAWTIDDGGVYRLDLGNGRKAAARNALDDSPCIEWVAWACGTMARGDGRTLREAMTRAERWLEEHP